MSDGTGTLTCPECGEWIGRSSSYCMHCATDLSEYAEPETAEDVDDEASHEDESADVEEAPDAPAGSDASERQGNPDDVTPESAAERSETSPTLDPDGFVDDSLTVVTGVVAGIVVGLVGSVAFLLLTGNEYGLVLGVVAWIVATAHLVRRRTVQEAVSHGGYAVAAVLLLVPVAAVSPAVSHEGGLGARLEGFAVFLAILAVPAAVAAGVGYFAGKYVPDDA